jgi:hypothetical protein
MRQELAKLQERASTYAGDCSRLQQLLQLLRLLQAAATVQGGGGDAGG